LAAPTAVVEVVRVGVASLRDPRDAEGGVPYDGRSRTPAPAGLCDEGGVDKLQRREELGLAYLQLHIALAAAGGEDGDAGAA